MVVLPGEKHSFKENINIVFLCFIYSEGATDTSHAKSESTKPQ